MKNLILLTIDLNYNISNLKLELNFELKLELNFELKL
jgi:hypothetical protein